MKIKLTDLNNELKGEKFVLVCPTSYEPRWYSVLSNIDQKLISRVIILKQSNIFPAITHGIELLDGYDTKFEKYDLNLLSPVKKALSLKSLFLNEISPSDRLVVDITTFTHENFLMFYQFLDQFKSKESVTFLYTGAKEYCFNLPNEEKWLSRGVRDIRSVFGFPGVMYPSLRTHLVILAGFESERAEKLIKELEPAIISLGVPEVSSHYVIERQATHDILFQKLDSFIKTTVKVKSRVERFDFSCADAYATKRAIERQVNSYHGYNVILSPMNTKVSTLGAALAATDNDLIQICYVEPVEYNTEYYSTAGDEVSVIRSLVDSVTSVGNLIGVKNDLAIRDRLEELSIAPNLISKFFDARQKRPASSKGLINERKLEAAAKSFANLTKSLDKIKIQPYSSDNGIFLLYYYSVMNEALCYISLKKFSKALALYSSLEGEFENYPVLSHRLGQVHSRMGQYSKSIKCFEKVVQLIKTHEEEQSIGGHTLPEVDYEHLKEHSSLLLGYEYWVKSVSDSTLSIDDNANLLMKAYESTKLTIGYGKVSQDTLREAYNNSLYYLLELSRNSHNLLPPDELDSLIKENIICLDQLYANDECRDIDILDTLMKSSVYTDDIEKALFYARKIIDVGDELNETQDGDAGINKNLRDALNLVRTYEFKVLA